MCGKVSIIIPVYNRELYITECINSVLNQTHKNFEIILIDDGSTDKTLEICEGFIAYETRIKLLRNEHKGVSAARNSGLDSASGEYVFFLDSDDIIHPNLLEALVNGMSKNDCSISGTGVVNVNQFKWETTKHIIQQNSVDPEFECNDFEKTLNAFFTRNTPINLIGGVMMRRDLIGDTRFNTDLFIGEDFYFIYENIIKGAKALFLKQSWYYARIHNDNISKQYDFDAFWTRFYRRVLVWKNEEKYNRLEYVKRQKLDALGVFFRCMKAHKEINDDIRKMCNVIKDYKREIFPILSLKSKIKCFIYVYFPKIYFLKAKIRKS